MPEGIVFLPSYHKAIALLPDNDRLLMYDALICYGLYGEIKELPPNLQAFFELIKPIIDSSQNRYRAAVENGKKGGAPKGNQNALHKKQPENNQTDNQNINQDYNYDFDNNFDFDSGIGKGVQRENRSIRGYLSPTTQLVSVVYPMPRSEHICCLSLPYLSINLCKFAAKTCLFPRLLMTASPFCTHSVTHSVGKIKNFLIFYKKSVDITLYVYYT